MKNAKPQKNEYKLFDGGGLFLLVTPSEGKHWYLKYRFEGKEKKLNLGPYPEISLTRTREKREEARTQVANPMKDTDTTKKTSIKHDWSRFDSMSEEQRHAAAVNDPNARPVSHNGEKRMKRTPQVKIIRRALGLSQEDFAARFHIPLGTLRDWEQHRKKPDAAARAYLVVIARNPEAVADALQSRRCA